MRKQALLIGISIGGSAVLLVGFGWLDQATPSRGRPPAFSVSIDNGRMSARHGDLLTYRTRVRSHEQTPQRLVVTQLLPAALNSVSTTSAGRADARKVVWTVRLEPGQEAVLAMQGRVGDSRNGYGKLTTTSCLSSGGRPSFSCASDSDALAVPGRASIGRPLVALGVAAALTLAVLGISSVVRSAIRRRDLRARGPRRAPGWLPEPLRGSARRLAEVTASAVRQALVATPDAANAPGDHGRARGPPRAPV